MKFFKAFSIVLLISFSFAYQVFAAGNIDSVQKYSQFLNIDLDNNATNDFINWSPTNAGATVTDSAITGNIWGDTVGWINLNPTKGGVTNSCSGVLGGYAWGQNTGWINFAPTNAIGANQPKINTTTGAITGTVWSQNYGWIQLSSPDGTYPGLTTSWHGCTNTGDVCPNIAGTQTSVPTGMIIDTNGNCVYPPPPGNGPAGYYLRVIKHVVNTGGGTKSAADFTMHVKNNGNVDIFGSPFAGSETGVIVAPGQGTFTVSEDAADNSYTRSFSGDCNALGSVVMQNPGTYTCIVTNTYRTTQQIVRGCTDPRASNYNPRATVDNGTCRYPSDTPVYGCTDVNALNYNPNATINDGSCMFQQNNTHICSDGLDNDVDGLVDYPSDPGCISAVDDDERNPGPFPPVRPDGSTDDGLIVSGSGWHIESIGDIAKPIAAIVSTVGLLSTIPGFGTRIVNLIFSIPFYRRRRPWGIVYDSETKEPIDPAYVTVYNADTNAIIDTKITDINGRYGFLLPVGNYKMVAQKTHYVFPSQKLMNKQSDDVYNDLYFGDVFSVTGTGDDNAVILNMPMDRTETDWNQEEKQRMGIWNFFTRNTKLWAKISFTLFVLGFAFSVYALIVYPTIWNIIVFSLYLAFTLMQIVGFGPVAIGTITDRLGNPIPHAVVRVWNAHLGTQIAQRVANEKGQYYLLVSKGDYYVTVDSKNASGGFDRVFTSETMKVTGGVINKDFKIS